MQRNYTSLSSQTGSVVIIGAGPAGLTAAHILQEAGWKVCVLEGDAQYVGGISRTVQYKGFRFDIGGHRFFSKSKEIEEFWSKLLGDDLIERPRLSRIYYRNRFYTYPLKALETLRNLGVIESTRSILSYVKAVLFPKRKPRSFEDWVTNKFGKRLYTIFFKTYTEKVWGMDCKDISADWAAQRIKGLSLMTAIKNAVLPNRQPKNKGEVVKTLINTFRYPRLGPGMMWEKCAEEILAMGGEVFLGTWVNRCRYSAEDEKWEVEAITEDGTVTRYADHVISTAAIQDLAKMLEPSPSTASLEAAGKLRYRDFITVAIIAKDRQALPDNWIYIHEPSVKVGRVQNFKSWSPELVPDPEMACYGMEYFCNEGDAIWSMPESEILSMASRELEQLGLVDASDIKDGCVVRQSKAYPVYDDTYQRNVAVFANELCDRYPNLHLAGRNGMHKYNNQDHAMMTAMLTARNIMSGRRDFDVWQVNEDAAYHESGTVSSQSGASGLRAVPARVGQC